MVSVTLTLTLDSRAKRAEPPGKTSLLLQAINNAGAPFLRCKSKLLHVADGLLAAQVLGHQIGRVELTRDLFHHDAPFTSQVLEPQVGNLQMSYLPQSCALADVSTQTRSGCWKWIPKSRQADWKPKPSLAPFTAA